MGTTTMVSSVTRNLERATSRRSSRRKKVLTATFTVALQTKDQLRLKREREEKVINIDLEALRRKFVEEDCPILMKALELPDEPIPLWWTADMINASLGECWTAVPVAEQKWVVGEFNCSCVGISKCLPAYCKPDTPNVSWKDIPAEEA